MTISGIHKDAEPHATRLAQDVARAARNKPGFVAWYGAVTEDSKTVAISFRDSEDALSKPARGPARGAAPPSTRTHRFSCGSAPDWLRELRGSA